MSRTTTRFIGAAAALLAAGLAGFSLRAQPHTVTTVAARNPAADVRTQVIRRTVHIVRHEHPRHAAGSRGVGATGSSYPGSGSGRAVGTHTSGSHYAASRAAVAAGAAGAVTTRTSASHAAATGSPVASGAPVTTRTSASHAAGSGGSTSSGGSVTTRTSSHGGSTSSGKVSTRSSGGGGGGEGADGGGNGD